MLNVHDVCELSHYNKLNVQDCKLLKYEEAF